MNKRNFRLSDFISAAGLLFIIYGFAFFHLLLPDNSFSEDENRALQTLPAFSFDSLTDGSLTAEISSYCADQMPFRNLFVGTKAIAETVLYKNENNGVLLGLDGYIIAKEEYPGYAAADANISELMTFCTSIGDKPMKVAVAGRSQDILFSKMPPLYPAAEISGRAVTYVAEAMSSLDTVDIITPLRSLAHQGEYVYYRTDHHWTTLGAYYAYAQIMNSLGMEPFTLDHFNRETVSNSFFGTTWSSAGMKWINPDSMEFFRFDGDTDFVCEIIDTNTSFSGFYDRSYLEKKDKYSAFIGGNNARVLVTATSDSNREKLLLIKDSFAHSVAPFLAAHFDLDIIDLRYYKPLLMSNPSVKELADNSDRVLVLLNLDSIYTQNNLAALNIGANK